MSATKRDSLKRMVRRGAHCPCADHPAPGVVYCKNLERFTSSCVITIPTPSITLGLKRSERT